MSAAPRTSTRPKAARIALVAPMPTPVTVQPQWRTPDQLKAAIGAVAIACLLLMIAAISGARSHRQAMQSVGKDAVPSIIAAQHIASALADMDASAVNQLLTKRADAATVGAFEARRVEAVNALVTAGENITYGDAERVPIQKLALGIGSYQSQIQQAIDLQTAGDKRYLDAYRAAAHTMDTVLLPAAADLDKANGEALDQTYSQHEAASSRSVSLVTLAALLVGCLLLWLQLFLAKHMRRIFNPLLVAATALTLIFLIYTNRAFRSEDQELKIAKQDAYDSIHALWQARAVAYSANGDESRALLDSAQADAYSRSFAERTARVANPSQNSGYLADELKNITFAGEREAAEETLSRFQSYVAIDQQIRKLEQSGQHQAAIALCIGNARGQSNYAFARFDEALGRTLEINQQAFDGAVSRGFADVAGFDILAPVAALIIALLAMFGLLPRIREYSA